MEQVKNDMSNMVRKFPEYYSGYFNRRKNDEKLIQVVTQPFWQSMRLSKKRLDTKDVTMELSIVEEKRKSVLNGPSLYVNKDGNHLVGMSSRNLQVERVFRKNDKKIYSKKESEIGVTSMMQSNIEGGEVACPNCGFVEKVESFIDGCDACGSKFEVQDFETKVSGFSLEENAGEKLSKTAKRTFLALGILIFLLVVGAIVGLMVAVVRTQMGYHDAYTLLAIMGLPIAIDVVPICIGCIISLPIVYLFLRMGWIKKFENRYANEEIVKSVIPAFSAEDFCQNLEYKLRNIHMANTVEEVSTFAKCSLHNVVEGYQDVVDCNISHVKFVNATRITDGYVVDVEVLMKLMIYKGNRIAVRYEKLLLEVYGSNEVVMKKSTALREYKCDNCNSSINILEGSTCQYCGSAFDYSDYGWMIKEYQIQKKSANVYRWTRTVLIGGYLFAFAMCVFLQGLATDSGIFLLKEIAASYKVIYDTSEEIQEICENSIVSTDGKNENGHNPEKEFQLELEYYTSDVATDVEECVMQMKNEGYVLVEETQNTYVFYRYEEAGEGDIRITITRYEDKIGVFIEPLVTFEYHYHS